MVSLPHHEPNASVCGPSGCGSTCGAGLEEIYPTTAVRYGVMNYIGEFRYKPRTVFKCGARIVVQTDRGIELGEQVSLTCGGCDKSVTREQIATYVKNSGNEYYRLRSGKILREATNEDLTDHERLNAKIVEECENAALLAAQCGLEMKIVTVEHLLGGERVVYYFMADGRVDFRALVHELADRHQTRIEMRQVGPRDEARLVADYEICGRECCCKNFLKTLRPISMKMAKIQKATLDLSKVSGRCGRLRCCLRYEHEGYESLAKNLPRKGVRVRTEFGVGTVVDKQILTQLVMIRAEDGKVITVPLEEITEFDVAETVAAPPKPPAPAPRPSDTAQAKSTPLEKRPQRRRRRRSGKPGRGAQAGTPERSDQPKPAQPQSERSASNAGPPPPAQPTTPAAKPSDGDAGRRRPGQDTSAGRTRSDRPKRRRRRRRGRRQPDGGTPPATSDG